MRCFAVAIFFLSPFYLRAQVYQKITYSVDEGLVTHLTKSLETDSLGFLWIATDEGLVRYNGHRFTTFTEATPNRYVKELITTSKGRLLAISDMGIVEIHQKIDTVYFEDLILGSNSYIDSLLSYPKHLFEDHKSRFWVAEPGTVSQIDLDEKKIIKRYTFPQADFSVSFTNSFKFFELGNTLYSISYTGRLHRYNEKTDNFEWVDYVNKPGLTEVSSVCVFGSNILVGGSQGVFRLTEEEEGMFLRKTRLPVKQVSCIRKILDYLLIGTYTNQVFLVNSDNMEIVEEKTAFRMNDALSINGDDIWISTDEGIVLLKKNIFRNVGTEEYYIESVLPLDSIVYYCYKDELFKITRAGDMYKQERLLGMKNRNNYFLSITGEPDKIWVSNKQKVHMLVNDKVVKTLDLSQRGLFIFNLFEDKEKDLWLTQDNASGILKIEPNGEKVEYQQNKGITSRILIITSDRHGAMYCGGLGRNGYLYKYDSNTDRFDNLSIPLQIKSTSEYEINDLVVRNDSVWLASSLGVWLYKDSTITQLKLDKKMTNTPVKAIDLYGEDLWFSNIYGLISYNLKTEEIRIYDEGSGLRSRSANARAMKVDEFNGTKWIGTAKGLSYSTLLSSGSNITKKPIIDKLLVNGTPFSIKSLADNMLPNDAFLRVEFFSLSLPGELLQYQYKIEGDEDWSSLGNVNNLEYSTSGSGKHTLYLRSKRQGNYSWSDAAILTYDVARPFYLQLWFIVMVFISFAGLVYLVYKINGIRLKRLEITLNRIVDERTDQLRKTNKELKQTNKELDMFVYSASHDLKAPLASLNGLIDLYKIEKDETLKKELIAMMSSSINKLDTFIKEVIDYSKNSRMDVIHEEVDFKRMVKDILDSYRYMQNFHDINFELNFESGHPYFSDKNRTRIILNNLISNAIRYCDLRKPTCEIIIDISQTDNSIIIKVSDNGIGIMAEHLPKIYDMFYRAAETQTGSGLGLYIVKESVNNLNGIIEVTSEIGKGSIFTVILPQHREL